MREKLTHCCRVGEDSEFEVEGYGMAATWCCEYNDNGKFFVDNGEYGNQVNFCPFCGEKAKVQYGYKKLDKN